MSGSVRNYVTLMKMKQEFTTPGQYPKISILPKIRQAD